MDKNEAKLLLQSGRPNGQDSSRPGFAEALAMVERDPELKAWWGTQQKFDRKVSAKLGEVPLPADLRANILAGHKMVPITPGYRFPYPYRLAIAAMIAFLLVIGFYPRSHSSSRAIGPIANSEYTASVLPFLGHDNPDLAMMSPDKDKLVTWLKDRNSPTGSLPSGMADLASLGCQTLNVHGHTVSLICFSVADGKIVHLFIIDQKALSDPPGTSPEFKQAEGWSTASWSDGAKSYVLATSADPDTLKHLL